MGISDKLKAIDDKVREDIGEKEKNQIEEEKNKRVEKIKAIIEDPSEELDKLHWYAITYFDGYSKEADVMMTERECRIAEVVGRLGQVLKANGIKAYPSEHRVRLANNHEMSKEEEIKWKAAEEKIRVIKAAGEDEKRKKALFQMSDGEFGQLSIETDDEHAALCSVNCNIFGFFLSDDLERRVAEQERRNHPIKYTLFQIRGALKNRAKSKNIGE